MASGKIRNLIPRSTESIAAQAREDFLSGRYRDAIDGFKLLYKREGERYLNPLVESYEKLAHDKELRGFVGDANVIRGQIAILIKKGTSTPYLHCVPSPTHADTHNETEPGAKSDIDAQVLDFDPSANPLTAPSADPSANRLNDRSTHPSTDEAIHESPSQRPTSDQSPKSDQGPTSELRIIQDALQAISAGDFTEASERVRAIGRASPFSNWRLFVKGLIAYFQGEDQRAIESFRKLAPDTVPYRAARPYLWLLEGSALPKRREERSRVCHQLLAVLGYTGPSEVLARAEDLWVASRFRDSAIQARSLEGFPSDSGIVGALTDFYFKCLGILPREAASSYVELFLENLERNQIKKSLEGVLTIRMACNLFEGQVEKDEEIREMWNLFLEAVRKELPRLATRRLETLISVHLGELYSMPSEDLPINPFFDPPAARDGGIRNSRLAIEAFTAALESDPENSEAYRRLLDVYLRVGKKREANRLLDTWIDRCPKEKQALSRAGVECVNRRAYVKGIHYLEEAHALDPTDAWLRNSLHLSYTGAAQDAFRKSQLEKGRALFQKASRADWHDRENLARSRPLILTLWALDEFGLGDPAEGKRHLRTALDHPDCGEDIRYFGFVIARAMGIPAESCPELEASATRTLKEEPRLEIGLRLLKILEFIGKGWQITGLPSERRGIFHYCLRALGHPCDRELVSEAVEIAANYPRDDAALQFAFRATDAMLARDRQDARFLFYDFQRRKQGSTFLLPRSEVKKLQSYLELARKQNDRKAERMIESALSESEASRQNLPFSGGILETLFKELVKDDVDDDDDDDDDEMDDDDGPKSEEFDFG